MLQISVLSAYGMQFISAVARKNILIYNLMRSLELNRLTNNNNNNNNLKMDKG